MKFKIAFAYFFLIHFFVSYAQTKQLSLNDAVIKQRSTLAPASLKQLKWSERESAYMFVDSLQTLIVASAPDFIETKALSLDELNRLLNTNDESKLKALPIIRLLSKNEIGFTHANNDYHLHLSTKKLTFNFTRSVPDDAANMDENKLSDLAFTLKNNLFILQKDATLHKLSNDDEDSGIVTGSSVHRDEFGIHKGTYWSPSGKNLAFYRMDESMVTTYPIYDLDSKPASYHLIRYPMAGSKSHQVSIGVYNIESKSTLFLNTGEPKEQYLTNIAWSPDEKIIYVAVINRDQNHMKLNAYSALDGSFIQTLFEEEESKYVHPQHAIMFLQNDAGKFIWQSFRDGYNHLYLYDTKGKLIKQLTSGKWEVTDVFGSNNNGDVFFSATVASPLNRDFFCVNSKNGKITRLSKGDGVHNPMFSSDYSYALDIFSNVNTPREIYRTEIKSTSQQKIFSAPNPLKDFALASTELFSINNREGTDLYCRMIKPSDFDSTKKYPVVYYLYGGPNVQLIRNSWLGASDLWYHYMAQQGYIVFTLENRGTLARGKDFEQATFRQLGSPEINDHMDGVNYLKSLPYIDANRMGIFGWSYGGFMSIGMMTRNPGVFKVAVAGGPVIDWSLYEVMYTERYMDTPEQNPDGYEKSNLMNYVQQLDGKLLIIHGSSDNVVLWQHSLAYLESAVKKNKLVDYYVYPKHEHNVRGADREHLFLKITDYLNENLLRP
ncbi:MAG TPA: DPP IV N-terminal domain-containing protein [Bacteroidia bacterium]|nr:DPP IV N-terminal domain-containing protein [Bacteroidia bacterium]HNT80113.1 DPP IV N-terminal domain-containing protein [Bacteroidia bacterium]